MPVSPSSTPERPQERMSHLSREAELWDDLANVIYVNPDSSSADPITSIGTTPTTLLTLQIPCPVAARLELHGRAIGQIADPNFVEGSDFARLDFIINGVVYQPDQYGDAASHGGAQQQVSLFNAVDVGPGTHEVVLAGSMAGATAGLEIRWFRRVLMVRRGRKPVDR